MKNMFILNEDFSKCNELNLNRRSCSELSNVRSLKFWLKSTTKMAVVVLAIVMQLYEYRYSDQKLLAQFRIQISWVLLNQKFT